MAALTIVLWFGLIMSLLPNMQTLFWRRADSLRGSVRSISVEKVRISHEDQPREFRRIKVDSVSYDKKGNPTEGLAYDDYGFFIGKRLYSQSSRGLLSQTTLHDTTSRLIEKTRYGYDSGGNLTFVVTYDGKDRVISKHSYKYNLERKTVEEIIEDGRGTTGRKLFKLDANGNTTEIAYYDATVSLIERWLNKYDESGRLVEELLYNPDGSRRKRFLHDYQIDSQGNWIRRTTTVALESFGGLIESTFVTYRTIKYY